MSPFLSVILEYTPVLHQDMDESSPFMIVLSIWFVIGLYVCIDIYIYVHIYIYGLWDYGLYVGDMLVWNSLTTLGTEIIYAVRISQCTWAYWGHLEQIQVNGLGTPVHPLVLEGVPKKNYTPVDPKQFFHIHVVILAPDVGNFESISMGNSMNYKQHVFMYYCYLGGSMLV